MNRFASRCLLVLALAFAAPGRAQTPSPVPGNYPLEAYTAIGSKFAENTQLVNMGLTESQFNAFIEGIRAAVQGQPKPMTAAAERLHADIGRRLQAAIARESAVKMPAGSKTPNTPAQVEAYIKEAVKNFNLQRSDSGMAYGLISSGNAKPGPDDTVIVTYDAVAADAQTDLPQISVKEKRVVVSDLLPGLAEVVMMLAIDGNAMVILPPDLSYGDGDWPAGVQKGTPLIFTVKLHRIIAPN